MSSGQRAGATERAKRRQPAQARSRATVDAMLEAARLVLAQDGAEGLTTNRVAEVAGVSIGSLYQYFDSRETLLDAVVDAFRAEGVRRLDDVLRAALSAPQAVTCTVETYVHTYVDVFGGQRNAQDWAVARLAWGAHFAAPRLASVRAASERVAAFIEVLTSSPAGRAEGLRTPSPAQLFLLSRGLMGAVGAAVLEGSPLLASTAFRAELTALCLQAVRQQ